MQAQGYALALDTERSLVWASGGEDRIKAFALDGDRSSTETRGCRFTLASAERILAVLGGRVLAAGAYNDKRGVVYWDVDRCTHCDRDVLLAGGRLAWNSSGVACEVILICPSCCFCSCYCCLPAGPVWQADLGGAPGSRPWLAPTRLPLLPTPKQLCVRCRLTPQRHWIGAGELLGDGCGDEDKEDALERQYGCRVGFPFVQWFLTLCLAAKKMLKKRLRRSTAARSAAGRVLSCSLAASAIAGMLLMCKAAGQASVAAACGGQWPRAVGSSLLWCCERSSHLETAAVL